MKCEPEFQRYPLPVTGREMTRRAEAAALDFINARFPDCLAAFLAGSVVRGDATITSDLDLVIITPSQNFRESFLEGDWPIEAFVHTPTTYPQFFASDARRRQPSLPMMCAEGAALVSHDGLAERIKYEARLLLARGPAALTEAELSALRYQVTGLLDDFTGSQNFEEDLFIAAELTAATIELILSCNRQWSGRGKWAWRWLQRYNATLAETLLLALKAFHQTSGKSGLVTFVESSLDDAGGRLFAGYSAGK
jgi:hypothetical protein